MSYGAEQRPNYRNFPRGELPWITEYREKLGLTPGKEVFPELGLNVSGIDCLMPGDGERLSRWQIEGKKLTINTVIVSPDEGEELPLRALCYMADAIHLGTELERQGFNIKGLRIVNPCYLRVHCNGGDLEGQLAYGQAFCQSLASWKDQAWPGNALQISLDPGQPLLPSLEEEKASNFLDVISEDTHEALFARADRYSTLETTELYTRAHGPAWCYSHDSNLFSPLDESDRVINFMPKSELLFLVAIKEAGVLDTNPEIDRPVTLVSSAFTHAPYLLLSENEPSLEFITDPNHLHPLKAKLKNLSGDPRVAEIIRCINRLQWILEQQKRNLKKIRC